MQPRRHQPPRWLCTGDAEGALGFHDAAEGRAQVLTADHCVWVRRPFSSTLPPGLRGSGSGRTAINRHNATTALTQLLPPQYRKTLQLNIIRTSQHCRRRYAMLPLQLDHPLVGDSQHAGDRVPSRVAVGGGSGIVRCCPSPPRRRILCRRPRLRRNRLHHNIAASSPAACRPPIPLAHTGTTS